jgi:hypothetical protein
MLFPLDVQAAVETSRKYRHVAWYSLFVIAYMVVLYLQVSPYLLCELGPNVPSQLHACACCDHASANQTPRLFTWYCTALHSRGTVLYCTQGTGIHFKLQSSSAKPEMPWLDAFTYRKCVCRQVPIRVVKWSRHSRRCCFPVMAVLP